MCAKIHPQDKSVPSDDKALIQLWLHNHAVHTQRAYQRDVQAFFTFVQKPLHNITLTDLQSWYDTLPGAEASRMRAMASIKSLLSFAVRVNYLPMNVGAVMRMERLRDSLQERILSEEDVLRMIRMESNPRRHAFLRLLYVLGLRISEACALRWRDMRRNRFGGEASIFGKGGKTRKVQVTPDLWDELNDLRGQNGTMTAVIPGKSGGKLSLSAANRIVKHAAKRADLPPEVSAHWLRHACASHAQDNGAPPHVVQAMLGHASLATTTRYSHVKPGDGTGRYLKG